MRIAPINPYSAAPPEFRAVTIADGAILRINPHAIAANWQFLAARHHATGPQSAIGAAVKANAYGVGVAIAAPALAGAGANYYFMRHFQTMAEIHFTLRKIERHSPNPEPVRVCFDALVQAYRADQSLFRRAA